jgi:chaperone BCS1
VISALGYLINYLYETNFNLNFTNLSYDDIKGVFYKKNTVVLEGKRSSTISGYNYAHNISSVYSNRFKAILDYIILNIDKIDSIYRIKEAHSTFQSSREDGDKKKTLDIYMVYQNKHFKIDDNIFVKVEIEEEQSNDEKEKISSKTDKITVHIYSYVYSVNYIKNYLDNITEKYVSSIKENRSTKKFIYFLDTVETKEDNSWLDCWREDIFESARTFNNIFFDGKKELLAKIDFFLKNREWYYEKGIPYSLGIGLHGPPGTGKTSFIKALANHTGRHIIVMSLKTIKTKRQLEQFFFENTYSDKNERNGITFDKKIIVFEDIDCIGDIILDRSKQSRRMNSVDGTTNFINENNKCDERNKLENVLQNICDLNDFKTVKTNFSSEDPITLDDILNLWDGIRETPGRILIISSNHYDKLDPALIRPGRIDITHELSKASHNTISEIYCHLFGTKIDKNSLRQINEYFYSPAELINIYVSHKNRTDFLKRVLQNQNV